MLLLPRLSQESLCRTICFNFSCVLDGGRKKAPHCLADTQINMAKATKKNDSLRLTATPTIGTLAFGTDIFSDNVARVTAVMEAQRSALHSYICKAQRKHRTHGWFEFLVKDLSGMREEFLVPIGKGCRSLATYLELTYQVTLDPTVQFVCLVHDLKTGMQYDLAMGMDGRVFCPSAQRPMDANTGHVLTVAPDHADEKKKEPPPRTLEVAICTLPLCSKLVLRSTPWMCTVCKATPYCDELCMAIDVPRHALASSCALKCSNATCKERELPGAKRFDKCSRCFRVVYCSRVCQAVDWKRRHRQDCPTLRLQQQRRRPSSHATPEQTSFSSIGTAASASASATPATAATAAL
jgi:hypothetical protein